MAIDNQNLYGELTRLEAENCSLKLHLKFLLKSIERNTDTDFFNWCLERIDADRKLGEQLGFKQKSPIQS